MQLCLAYAIPFANDQVQPLVVAVIPYVEGLAAVEAHAEAEAEAESGEVLDGFDE